ASAIAKMLEPGVPYSSAKRQLSLAYGYVPFHGTENMREFFRLYEEWLARLALDHSPRLFRHWAIREYCPGPYRGDIEFVDWPAHNIMPLGEARVLHIRAHNKSVRDWRFKTGTSLGVHIHYRIANVQGGGIAERAGLFDAVVAPGDSIGLELGIPRLPAGEY